MGQPHFDQNLSKVIPTTISKASFPSVTLNDRTQKIRRKLEEDALSESRGDFFQLTNLIAWDVTNLSAHAGYNSSVSCQHRLTNGACNHWKRSQILWIMGMLLSAPLKESRCVPDDLKESVRLYFPSTRNTRTLICRRVNNYRAPGSRNSSRICLTFVFPLHLQVLFFSSGSSGSLALSAAAPPVNYHISNFPPAQIRPLLPAWPSCLLWGGLSSSSLTVNR